MALICYNTRSAKWVWQNSDRDKDLTQNLNISWTEIY